MKTYCFALAALAALGLTGAALAEDGTWTTTTGPAAMSDAEMAGVTAAGAPDPIGQGVNTARAVTSPNVPNDGTTVAFDNGHGLAANGRLPGNELGHGVCTAGHC